MTARKSHRPLAWWRVIFAIAACLGLAFEGVTPHDMAADRAGAVSRMEIAESAVHPDDPAHLEQAEMKVHPGCVACLLQLETRTVLGKPPIPLPPLARDAYAAASAVRVSSRDAALLGPARAPPALLSA
jgi:hypothetical protein